MLNKAKVHFVGMAVAAALAVPASLLSADAPRARPASRAMDKCSKKGPFVLDLLTVVVHFFADKILDIACDVETDGACLVLSVIGKGITIGDTIDKLRHGG